MTDLKPCPFCGADADFRLQAGNTGVEYLVECVECGAISKPVHRQEQTITAWNTRVADRGLIAPPEDE